MDIGCGMGAVRTSIDVLDTTRDQLRDVVKKVKETVPCGEGRAHKKAQNSDGKEGEENIILGSKNVIGSDLTGQE